MAPFAAIGLTQQSTGFDATVLLAVANIATFVRHASKLRTLTRETPAPISTN